MAAITAIKQGNTMELKNNSLNGGLNLIFETHYADMDNSADSIEVTTGLKQVFGYIITQLSGTAVPGAFSSTLVPTTAGVLTINAKQDAGGSAALAVFPDNVNLKIILFGLSY